MAVVTKEMVVAQAEYCRKQADALKKEIAAGEQRMKDAIQELNSVGGAIQICDFFLNQIEQESKKESPDGTVPQT